MDAKTFDLSDMLTGQNFPTEELVVFLDEGTAYRLSQVEKKLTKDAENEALLKEQEALIEKARESRFVVHLKGVPRDQHLAALEAVTEKYPVETNGFGRPKNNPQADEEWFTKLWSLYITGITNPEGAQSGPLSEEEAHTLRRGLPAGVSDKITETISSMITSTRKGFESLAMETDFLSQR